MKSKKAKFTPMEGCAGRCPIERDAIKHNNEICCMSSRECCYFCFDDCCPIKDKWHIKPAAE